MTEILGLTQVDPLAERYRIAFDKTTHAHRRSETARADWIEATLELAAIVLEARNLFPDHVVFSGWLGRNGLQMITQAERSALLGFARDLEAARKLLQQSTSYKWRTIWEHVRKGTQRAPSEIGRGAPPRISRRSGHAIRQRAARIPDVMQEPGWVRPVRPVVPLKGLTREEVDPDFKGNAIEFAAKYGPVTLHTKAEIEESKRQDALQKWLGAIASHVRTAEALPAPPDPETLAAWLKTPGKAAKLRGWQEILMRAARLPTPACDINSPEVMARMDAELECAIPIREPRLL